MKWFLLEEIPALRLQFLNTYTLLMNPLSQPLGLHMGSNINKTWSF